MQRWNLADAPWFTPLWPTDPFCRVMVDNDFAGDPDDFFQLAHHLLCPEVEIVGVICSHLRLGDQFTPTGSMEAAYDKAKEVFDLMDIADDHLLLKGAPEALKDRNTPIPSAGSQAIIDAALDPDATTPLYIACGGGLTDLASAYLMNPEIAKKMTVIWNGGPEYPGHGYPSPGSGYPEYNQAIDPIAAQVVFNDSDIDLWQIPRDAYRQCVVGQAELSLRLSRCGKLGEYLIESVAKIAERFHRTHEEVWSPSTYDLGDQSLVLLTALQTFFQPDPGSSDYMAVPRPILDDCGHPVLNPAGRTARIYTRLDTRLVVEDMFAKFEAFAAWHG